MEEELPALQAQMRAQAAQQQLYDKAMQQDYAGPVDMSAAAQAAAPAVTQPPAPQCRECGANVTGAKFCPQCGTPAQTNPVCRKCSYEASPGAKFCPQCGNRMS
jgi:RNA polymerase subunit RPABC4/transcription elongation factor Spt4